MAKHSVSIFELVRKGATHRYQELKAELATLVKHFPHLGSAVSPAMPNEAVKPGRKRREMSTTARKKISEAQKTRRPKVKARKGQKLG